MKQRPSALILYIAIFSFLLGIIALTQAVLSEDLRYTQFQQSNISQKE